MRKLIAIITFLFTLPALAAKPISVDQLARILASIQGQTDTEVARQITDLRLTERVSSVRLVELQKQMPGDRSRQALLALADESAFLNPPASEMPAKAAPDLSEQRHIMALIVAYVGKTIPQLPNFLATRQTMRFQDSPLRQGAEDAPFLPLHPADNSSVTVLYRDGREVVDSGASGEAKSAPPERGLRTWGEFGPILSTVLLDAAQNKIAWGHWEQGDTGLLVVFTFAVPKEKSHYEVVYCCIVNSEETRANVFHELAGYHGEMTIDAETGAIRRLKIEADLRPGEPVSRAALLVEYAPVEIGGMSYICPVRSIAVSRAQTETQDKDILIQSAPHSGAGAGTVSVVHTRSLIPGPQQTLLNDSAFLQYHVFRSESRVLTGVANDVTSAPAQEENAVTARSESPGVPAAGATNTNQSDVNAALPSAVGVGASNSYPTASDSHSTFTKPTDERPDVPEISFAPYVSPPDVPPAAQIPWNATGFMLRSTSRLVDVAVVALDKKGHPLTDIKPGDLEIYDDGHLQQIRYFTQAEAGSAQEPNVGPEEPTAKTGPEVFRNFPANAAVGSGMHQPGEPHTTIFLIDASNVVFGDVTYARGEILRFLKTVPGDEHIGLYVLTRSGFQIVIEPTTDHVELATKLKEWMPSAMDLARAQNQEERNRQQMEYVHNVADLFYVNGNTPNGGTDIFAAVDPQLRSLGDNPARDALTFLIWVARHVAANPGHKNVIWVSSDNVLADFSEKAPSVEKGEKYIDPVAIRAREALNDAHISIYPLDASQLEAGGVGANVRSANVQLAPTANEEIQLQALPGSEKQEATENLRNSQRNINPGRVTAQLQQDAHPIQAMFRELAEATGGRALRRAGDIAAELDRIVADGRAACLLSFTPDTLADDKYHVLTVKTTRPGVTLRFRTGYLYAKEPATLKERFHRAVWQPSDVDEIALSAVPGEGSKDGALKLTIAALDLALSQQGEFWTDKLDIFVIERDDAAEHAKLTGQTVSLRLSPATYQAILKEGLTIEEPVRTLASGALRVVVADENSGRMGTVTIPVAALGGPR